MARRQKHKGVLLQHDGGPLPNPQRASTCKAVMQTRRGTGFECQLATQPDITRSESPDADLQMGQESIN
jgi:hypothetical protein